LESGEVTGRGQSIKCAVGAVVVVEVLEAVDDGIEGFDRAREVPRVRPEEATTP